MQVIRKAHKSMKNENDNSKTANKKQGRHSIADLHNAIDTNMRIKIIENGPYHVTGSIPIREMIITQQGNHNILTEGRKLPQAQEYFLCRCGESHNAPFCDGSHVSAHFNGAETASRAPYTERIVDVVEGTTMKLLDDDRCAFARFCHAKQGDVWSMTERDDDPEIRESVIKAVCECPSGRLVLVDNDGYILEDINEPEILIVQDPAQNSSASIHVKGPIIIEAADGTEYEVRNRVALCRCGKSRNKPFCDASHVKFSFDDGYLK